MPRVTQPPKGKARTPVVVSLLPLIPDLGFPPVSCPVSAPINSVLLFVSGMACAVPLLRSAGPAAAPKEVFRGRTLLSVEPGSKVRCGCVTGACGVGTGPSQGHGPLPGSLGCHVAPLAPPGPLSSPLPSQPFTQQEVIGFVIGSVSSVLYLLSRLPQIRTNVSLGQGRVGPPGQGVGSWCPRSGFRLPVGLRE